MLYRFVWVLAVCTGIILPGIGVIAQQDDAKHLVAEGDRLAGLKNWQGAEPYFAKAEALFHEAGDRRNELYAQIGRIRGELQKRGLFETSAFLDSLLDEPLLKNDAQLRLRCVAVKGDVDVDFDTDLAERDWTEALSVAKGLGDSAWINRANGELGLISFLHGDYTTGALRVMGALSQAQKLNDLGGQIRYLTLIGDGLLQIGRYDQAIAMFDQAIAVGRGNPDLGEPAMANAGKAQALESLGKNFEAKGLPESLLEISRGKSAFGYESQALLELGNLEERLGQEPAAIDMEAQEDPAHLRQQTQPITITRLQKALGVDEAILEYVLTEPVSYCLAISREHAEVFKLASRAQIGKQVEQVLAALRKDRPLGDPAAALYATIVAPLESVVSAKTRLIVIPDGPCIRCHSTRLDHGPTGFCSHLMS